MPATADQFAVLDGQIAEAAKAASSLASTAKSLRAKLRDLLVGSGLSKQARDLQAKLADTSNEQSLAEELRATLAERRAQLAAEQAAAEAAKARKTKVDAFKALVAKRDAAAERAEAAAEALGRAVQDMTATTTDIRLSLAGVGLPRNAVDPDAVRYGVEGSLFFAGLTWLFADKPLPKYDAQGNLVSNIEERIKRADAALLAMLPQEV